MSRKGSKNKRKNTRDEYGNLDGIDAIIFGEAYLSKMGTIMKDKNKYKLGKDGWICKIGNWKYK
jgi:hypothetical protein